MRRGKMDFVKIQGKNKTHKVLMYALSTCAWCKLAKQFLKDNSVEFEYVDVDRCNDDDKEKIKKDILSRRGSLSYPTIVVDNRTLITGFRKDKLKETLEL